MLSIYLFIIINKTLCLLLYEFSYFHFHFHFHYCHCYYFYLVFSYFYSHILFSWDRKFVALARSRTDGLKLLRNSLDLMAEGKSNSNAHLAPHPKSSATKSREFLRSLSPSVRLRTTVTVIIIVIIISINIFY